MKIKNYTKFLAVMLFSGILVLFIISACGDSGGGSGGNTSPSNGTPSSGDDSPNTGDPANDNPPVYSAPVLPDFCSLDVATDVESIRWQPLTQDLYDNYVNDGNDPYNFFTGKNFFFKEDITLTEGISQGVTVNDQYPIGRLQGCGYTLYLKTGRVRNLTCTDCFIENLVFDYRESNVDSPLSMASFLSRTTDDDVSKEVINIKNVALLGMTLIDSYNSNALFGMKVKGNDLEFTSNISNVFVHIKSIHNAVTSMTDGFSPPKKIRNISPFNGTKANLKNIIIVYDLDDNSSLTEFRLASAIYSSEHLNPGLRLPDLFDESRSINLSNIFTVGKVSFIPHTNFESNEELFPISEWAISPGLYRKYNNIGTYENIYYDSIYHFEYDSAFTGEKFVTAAGYNSDWSTNQDTAQIVYPQYKADDPENTAQNPALPKDPSDPENTTENRQNFWKFGDESWIYSDGKYPVLNGHPLTPDQQRAIIEAARQ